MAPSSATVGRLRFWLLVAVRIIGVTLLVYAAYNLVWYAADTANEVLFTERLNGVLWPFLRLCTNAISSALPPALLAALLLRFDRRLVHYLAPTPGVSCPGCGYPLRGLKFAICPECGLAVTPASAGSQEAHMR